MPSIRARLTALAALMFFATDAFALNVNLRWSAPGDNVMVGTADVYELRRATYKITPANFASAPVIGGMPTPLPAGSTQGVTVTLPSPDTLFYFAIRARDRAGNWSGISNVVTTAAPLGVANSFPSDGLASPRPNPARVMVGLHLSLSHVGHAAVEVYDLSGRRSRVLLDSWLPSGEREIAWDLRDDSGRRVPAGVYFVRARAEGWQGIQRVQVLG